MLLILGVIILVPIVIVYYNAKNKYLEAHPEKIKMYKCSFCGREFREINGLSDGAICEECSTISVNGQQKNIFLIGYNKGSKHSTCGEARTVIEGWKERESDLANMTVTRSSESGRILVDDNHGLIVVKDAGVAVPHKLSTLKDFYLEYDYEDISSVGQASSYEVKSGHVTINFYDFYEKEEVHAQVDSKFLTQRNEVKKVFESDLQFLEALTGKERRPIPNKVKIF